jgi:signal transduction histidine kinase
MRRWRFRLHTLPLRLKLGITLVGGALAVLGGSTFFSFRYWKGEALIIAEQQALLAGGAVRGSVEAALAAGQPVQARRSLQRLVDRGSISRARVYTADGRILFSSVVDEEGTRPRPQWLPGREVLGEDGLVRFDVRTETVEAFLPLARSEAPILHVSFPVGPVRTAMDRGLKVGLALVVASMLAIALLVSAVIEREVVAPVRRVSGLLGMDAGAPAGGGTDEIRTLADSVRRLLEKEKAVERMAREQDRRFAAQAGLAEVGGLAAEMAHEFKRPLTTIRTALDVIDQEYQLDPRGETLLQGVQEQLDKLSETMRDLFAIAKPIELNRESVRLDRIVNGALMQLASHPALQQVEVEREYSGDTAVRGDAPRLEQLFLNLMLNAAEAMPGGGTLSIRLQRSGDTVRAEVADTGVGIPPEEVEKVFLPFYSTKPAGTGLGLALCARIVVAHAGAVKVESQPGRGTTIRVELPAAAAEDERHATNEQWLTHAS